jgi:hypothetical protein
MFCSDARTFAGEFGSPAARPDRKPRPTGPHECDAQARSHKIGEMHRAWKVSGLLLVMPTAG